MRPLSPALLGTLVVAGFLCACLIGSDATASAPRECAIDRGAYCIERSGLVVTSSRSPAGSTIRVYEAHWRDRPLIIEEPRSCRSARSNVAEILQQRDDGRKISFILRLSSNRRCDLRIIVNNENTDPAGNGIFTFLTQIRACERRHPCTGSIVGSHLRNRFGWNL